MKNDFKLFFCREIRRLTQSELRDFQEAVRQLKMKNTTAGGNQWDAMRDEYMRKAAIAQVKIIVHCVGVGWIVFGRAFWRNR